MKLKNLLLSTFLLSGIIHAENSVGIDINNKDVEVLGSFNLNTLTDYASGTTYLLDFKYLHADGDNLTTLGFLGQNDLQGQEGVALALGLKGVVANDFLSFPLTVKGSYTLPFIDSVPTTSVLMELSYAPNVLSFSDAQSYSDFRLEVDMEVISNIHLFTGYRNINTDYKDRDETFNNSFYGGMKLSF